MDASEYAKDFPQSTIIDKEALAKVSHVITFRETRSYWDWLESAYSGAMSASNSSLKKVKMMLDHL